VIVLIGHAGHDEVIGTIGEAPHEMVLVEDAKIAFLTQTTLGVCDTQGIIAALRVKYPQIVGQVKSDNCYATQNRQEAVRELSTEARVVLVLVLVLVLGSQNSSNSKRLEEIARHRGKSAYLIDTTAEIRDVWFRPDDTVMITVGASAPEDNVRECVKYPQSRFNATVESRVVREEHVSFPQPGELRSLPLIG
jgi:4-hydroxy-3-methylbut-2-en-1-yl diphosphate reductase